MNRSFIERIVDDSTTGQIKPSQEVLENLANNSWRISRTKDIQSS